MLDIKKINDDITLACLDLKAFSTVNQLNSKRNIEKKGSAFLIEKIMAKSVELSYTAEGSPYVKNESFFLSISHSHERLAVIINLKEKTGIDVELIRDKILGIQSKFLNENELACANNAVDKLIVYWAAKETLYKIYGLRKVDFIVNLFVEDFDLALEGEITGRIQLENFNKKYLLHYEKMQDYILVYALHELN